MTAERTLNRRLGIDAGHGEQVDGGKTGESALKFSDGGANGRDDDRFVHRVFSPLRL